MSTRLLVLASFTLLSFHVAACSAQRIDPPTAMRVDLESNPETTGLEGEAHGFPALRSLEGKTLADGEFTQWLDGDRLHLKIRYDFGPDRWIEESSVIRQEPTLIQEQWSWVEMRDGSVQRRFQVDFLSGTASAEKREENELRRWTEHMDLEPGQAFAGAAWSLAIKSVRARLIHGETIPFQTVGFTPEPRGATVEITHTGLDRLTMSGRALSGDRFRIHPKIPWIIQPFVDVPDSQIWLVNTLPAAFLRWEGPLAEPGDPLVRVDLLPGEGSGPASPATR